ncbi:hypothetical protein LIER_41149 [Lithospermum erythrorhizon]|uniref:Uncharacterized protein n=1 Tax=Lithospermum erythrorhizon TaxID=34254 RepID=A0AAV3R4Q4_LITER
MIEASLLKWCTGRRPFAPWCAIPEEFVENSVYLLSYLSRHLHHLQVIDREYSENRLQQGNSASKRQEVRAPRCQSCSDPLHQVLK